MTENGKRRPWWAAAIVGGFGAVLGVATLFGIIGKKAHSEQPPPAVVAASTMPPDDTQRWRERMEAKIDLLTEKVARIEGRLEPR